MMMYTSRSIDTSRLIQGFMVVLVGTLCWFYQAGHLSLMQLLAFWPLALIGVGLAALLDRSPRQCCGTVCEKDRSGWGWLLIGSLLLFGNLMTPESHSFEIRFGFFPLRISWPMLLIAIGGYFAWNELSSRRSATQEKR